MNDIFLLISLLTVCIYALHAALRTRAQARVAKQWDAVMLAWVVIVSASVWIFVLVGVLANELSGAAP